MGTMKFVLSVVFFSILVNRCLTTDPEVACVADEASAVHATEAVAAVATASAAKTADVANLNAANTVLSGTAVADCSIDEAIQKVAKEIIASSCNMEKVAKDSTDRSDAALANAVSAIAHVIASTANILQKNVNTYATAIQGAVKKNAVKINKAVNSVTQSILADTAEIISEASKVALKTASDVVVIVRECTNAATQQIAATQLAVAQATKGAAISSTKAAEYARAAVTGIQIGKVGSVAGLTNAANSEIGISLHHH